MFCKAFCGTVVGVEGMIIRVEADVSDGLPIFSMVGFLASEVKEAKDRVRIALKNAGFLLNPKRITVNLSPADVKKEGSAFDLSIAIAILAAFGYIPEENLENTLLLGELGLNGDVEKVNGVLPIVYEAKKAGITKCILPFCNALEGAVVDGIEIVGVKNIKEVVDYLTNRVFIEPAYLDVDQLFERADGEEDLDFSDVVGQGVVKRAIEIAVSGMHNLLMIGPPGSGKTMLAKRIPTIMPELSFQESIDITKIYSVGGLLDVNQALIVNRPFRSPHHTITDTALVGGGKRPVPGEISLASGGVLFLDELPEFRKSTLELLRQPIEERKITVSRLHGTYQYPSNMMLVGAMNPCNCGYYPDRNKCNCSINQVKRYLNKISRPLLDRIDLVIEAEAVEYRLLRNNGKEEASEEIRRRVKKAREIQMNRYKRESIYFNAELTTSGVQKYCELGKEEMELLTAVFDKFCLSARGYHRILKVARTIADLDESEAILCRHLQEAICYRSLDQKYWGV